MRRAVVVVRRAFAGTAVTVATVVAVAWAWTATSGASHPGQVWVGRSGASVRVDRGSVYVVAVRLLPRPPPLPDEGGDYGPRDPGLSTGRLLLHSGRPDHQTGGFGWASDTAADNSALPSDLPLVTAVAVVAVPAWFAVVAAAGVSALLWPRRALPAAGTRRVCRYDLRGPPGRCPECGTAPPVPAAG